MNDDLTIAEIFNHFFANITQELGITENEAHLSSTTGISDPVDIAIKKYLKHPSINEIKENWVPFTSSNITILEALHQLEILNAKKASPIGSIPAKY